MPVDMAVEEPDARVVGLESDHEVAQRSHHECVSPHWHCRKGRFIAGVPVALIFLRPNNSLEIMPMQMKRMLPGIIVIKDDLDDLIFFKDECIGVIAINGRI